MTPCLNKDSWIVLTVNPEERWVVFVWVPGNVGIRGNSAAYSAAKDALYGDIWNEFIPFSDARPRLNKNIFELWQHECGIDPEYKWHKILPKLTDQLPSRCFTRREDTALSRSHIGHSHGIHLFLMNRFHSNIFCCFVRIWLIWEKSRFAEGIVQRGFSGYYLQ